MGAVLAGGASRRMGQNKALMEFSGRTLIAHVVETLEAVLPKVTIVAKELGTYAFLGRPLLADLVETQSPLSGIYTALKNSEAEKIFVSACDLPFLTPEVVSLIVAQSLSADITAPRFRGHYEPLCAVYSRSCLPMIETAIKKGEYRIVDFWTRAQVRELDEDFWRGHGISERTFKNVNRPEDWQDLSRR